MSVAGATRRIGWLLRVNRLLGPDEALRRGRTFAQAFRSIDGRPLAPSQVTRWETGQLAPSRSTIRRYEKLLGLAPESLVTVADAVMRSTTAGASLREGDDLDPELSRDRLFSLLDRVTTASAMTGGEWSALTTLIADRPHLELYPPALWRDVADRLLRELVAAVGGEWLQRQEAMCRLLRHPAARPSTVTACITMAGDPTSPAVIEPMSLLDATPDPVANRYVLLQVEQPVDDRALEGALRAAARKVSLGHFPPDESTRLVAAVSTLMNDLATGDTMLPLAVEVGRRLAAQPAYANRLARRLPTAALAHQVWTDHRLANRTAARSASTRLATYAQNRSDPQPNDADTMLATLVEEALFLSDTDRRLIAAMLIGATPHRMPFAHVLLDAIKTDLARHGDSYPLTAALRALTTLRVDIHRPLIHEVLTQPGLNGTTRRAAAWATPYCSGRFTEQEWRQILASQLTAYLHGPLAIGQSILHGITFGIGTDRHHALLTHIRVHPDIPQSARTTAAWLLRAGQPSAMG